MDVFAVAVVRMTSAHDVSDMNSHETRNEKASSPRTTKSCRRETPDRMAGRAVAHPHGAHSRRKQACRNRSEIDDGEKKRGERINAKMRAEPGNSEGQSQIFRRACAEQITDGGK